ncbi:TerC family protein [Deinococcus sonorensis]|uniref:TerC family protein n=2 Tax=Deinococcus sonorensis TaxID=309891 RepID=A0AAU7U9S0_9DEIO
MILGIDKGIFISLPAEQQARAWTIGLPGAMVMRVLLLFLVAWLARLTEPIISVLGLAFSGRDLILLAGGLFLLYKAGSEMHEQLEGDHRAAEAQGRARFGSVIAQIMLFAAGPIGQCVQAHPTVRMLALAFLLMMGVHLGAEGRGFHIPERSTSFAMVRDGLCGDGGTAEPAGPARQCGRVRRPTL